MEKVRKGNWERERERERENTRQQSYDGDDLLNLHSGADPHPCHHLSSYRDDKTEERNERESRRGRRAERERESKWAYMKPQCFSIEKQLPETEITIWLHGSCVCMYCKRKKGEASCERIRMLGEKLCEKERETERERVGERHHERDRERGWERKSRRSQRLGYPVHAHSIPANIPLLMP